MGRRKSSSAIVGLGDEETSNNTKRLSAQIAQCRGSLTRAENFTRNQKERETLDIQAIELRLQQLENILKQYCDMILELNILNGRIEEEDFEADTFEDRCLTIMAQLKQLLSTQCHDNSKASNTKSAVRLPEIDIPTYDGKDFTKYQVFMDLFSAVIGKNSKLEPIQKLFYLRKYLKAEPLTLIEGLPLTGNSYEKALELLKNRYENKFLIINSHIQAILDFQPIVRGTASNLRELISHSRQHLGALNTLGQPTEQWDLIILPILLRKLDQFSSRIYYSERNRSELPKLEDFFTFIERRASSFEESQQTEGKLSCYKNNKVSNIASNVIFSCKFCKSTSHKLFQCNKYAATNHKERIDFASKNNLCKICLGLHKNKCKFHFKCSKCSSKEHHTLLHSENNTIASLHANITNNTVILPTIKAKIYNQNKQSYIIARGLVDSGSQVSFITSKLANLLNIKCYSSNLNISALGGQTKCTSKAANIKFESLQNNFNCQVTCSVVNQITTNLPQRRIDLSDVSIPDSVVLADKEFNNPGEISFLLSAEIFFQILLPQKTKLGNTGLFLINTEFGSIISGEVTCSEPSLKCNLITLCAFNCINNVEYLLQKFWETEMVPEMKLEAIVKQDACEAEFRSSVQLLNGKFQVSLPLIQPLEQINLGYTFPTALRMLNCIQYRLARDDKLHKQYNEFIDKYVELGHAKILPLTDSNKKELYFMQHLPVIRNDRKTTKLRVVFNANTRASKQYPSLNDVLLNGSNTQKNLFDILILFRSYNYVMLADIKHMYRAINIDPAFHCLQNILWRDKNNKLIILQLQTVTYGLKSSSFLATRCLEELAIRYEAELPKAAEVIRNNMYVDDALFGAESIVEAKQTSAVPGVWLSTDHVSIVWCKQLVMAINKYLFSIIDPWTAQVKEDKQVLRSTARQYFQANRSMFLNPEMDRRNVTMQMDAFWYEDNRRIYQISRPEINKTTYLMIRLVNFPQNRFVAVESVNISNRDWIYGCNANEITSTYRYCKSAMSLNELSRWTGAATNFGKRKLATVHLHSIKKQYPTWSHVVIKVAPTRRPIVLNVDINDHASRQITVNLPSDLSLGKVIVKTETEQDSLYYELFLPDFNKIHQAYLLYVEPTASCRAPQYHVSAEMHVPWAKNHEYYHYFTHLKQTPMKLRLFMSNPNTTLGSESSEHVKITLLLDPQCTYTISISTSWYHRLAQLARNYTPVLVPYVAAIVLLAARSSLLNLREHGSCLSIHGALMTEGVKPYYALVFARLGAMVLISMPVLSFVFENSGWNNLEMQYFARSLFVLPAYMTALGILNISAAAILIVMVFSSQLAHRLLFRIVWRGSSGLAERVASGLQKIPMLVSVTLVAAVPLSCGAASLAAGAAFYAFLLSKMYEEYLEDYVYKFMAKIASKLCRIFKSKNDVKSENETSLIKASSEESSSQLKSIEDKKEKSDIDDAEVDRIKNKSDDREQNVINTISVYESKEKQEEGDTNETSSDNKDKGECNNIIQEFDDDLNNIHFHMMLFFMWISVTIVNIPALLTWARNFKYTMVLTPDTSYHTGFVLSLCSAIVWQLNGPRRNLKHYDAVCALLFTMAVCILALGPLSLSVVNYGVTFMFVVITIQQLFDKEEPVVAADSTEEQQTNAAETTNENTNESEARNDHNLNAGPSNESELPNPGSSSGDCDVCSESRIYNVFKNLREKFTFNEDL